MRAKLRDYSDLVSTFDDAYGHAISVLRLFRNGYAYPQIGCVVGPLTSDGPEHVKENRRVLVELAGVLGSMFSFPVCTMQDLFSVATLRRLKDKGYTSRHYTEFACEILKSGYITDVFMSPRWEKSKSARAEHDAAERFGITIHYIEYE